MTSEAASMDVGAQWAWAGAALTQRWGRAVRFLTQFFALALQPGRLALLCEVDQPLPIAPGNATW
jgi:hypothetical protein